MPLYLPHTMYVLHRKTVTTNSQNTIVKITKPIHPGVLEGRIGSGRVNDTREGEKSTQISPEAAAGKCLKKTHTHTQLENSGPSRPWVVEEIHILESGRFQFKDKGIRRGPLAVGPAFHGRGRKTEKRAATSSPAPLTAGLSGLQQLSVWQEKDVVKGISLQRMSCSELTAGRQSCGKVCCLKRPPRRRGATGKDMLFQESLLHWR